MIGTSLLSMVQQISVQLKSKNMAFQENLLCTSYSMKQSMFYKSETQLKLKKSILECPNKGVKADAELAWYNTPELFLEEEA